MENILKFSIKVKENEWEIQEYIFIDECNSALLELLFYTTHLSSCQFSEDEKVFVFNTNLNTMSLSTMNTGNEANMANIWKKVKWYITK